MNDEYIEFKDSDFKDDFLNDDIEYLDDNIDFLIPKEPIQNNILNIDFLVTPNNNYRIKSKYDIFSENFYFEPMNLFDGNMYERFISETEKCIRTSMEYKAYIGYLKKELGLIYDAFNGNISQDDAIIEFHHGPIFTLYDYVKIMIDFAFDNDIPVTTFTIAKLIMNEHACNRIQGVMLSKNNHKLVHAGKLHINFNQCHGNLKAFIQLYGKYIKQSPKLLKKINDYKITLDTDIFNDKSYITPTKIISWKIENE